MICQVICAYVSPLRRHWQSLSVKLSCRGVYTSPQVAVTLRSAHASMFSVSQTDGKARTGTLTARQGEVATPAALIYTFRGSPLNLTPDLLESLGPDARMMHLDASQFVESPGPEVLRKFGGGAHNFFALQNCTLVASARDPMAYGIQRWRSGSPDGIRITTHSGHQQLSVTRYLEVVGALAPDYFAALSDEVPSVKVDHRRAALSVDRTLAWLDQCLGAQGSSAVLASIQGSSYDFERQRCAAEAAKRLGVAGFSLAGLGSGESREKRAALMEAATAELPSHLPRYLLAGAGTPEDALDAMAAGVDFIDGSYAVRAASAGAALLLRKSDRGQAGLQGVDHAETTHSAVSQPAPMSPRISPRHSGQPWRRASPEAAAQKEHSRKEPERHASESQESSFVLNSESAGCSSGELAPSATEQKPSFVHEVGTRGKSSRSPGTAEEWDSDDTTISLHSERFRRDTGPLSRGCPCHTCLRHTRAYIHHLLNVNEMLAEVLLEIHNSRNYLDFFADARRAISAGRFVDFRQAFLNRRSLRYSNAA
ncbi:probable Queuine tRNA-ribosyltransferase accessory subunit 2 [Coccomyxa sp. Obi]|nr:probable Queuine tRNA-ribosyltransferase accessory subunit 2 [Coccomyxa sp. Obi]